MTLATEGAKDAGGVELWGQIGGEGRRAAGAPGDGKFRSHARWRVAALRERRPYGEAR